MIAGSRTSGGHILHHCLVPHRLQTPVEMVVVALAHHVVFRTVQKSPEGGHRIFGFREEPITTDARFPWPRRTRPPALGASHVSRSGTIANGLRR